MYKIKVVNCEKYNTVEKYNNSYNIPCRVIQTELIGIKSGIAYRVCNNDYCDCYSVPENELIEI